MDKELKNIDRNTVEHQEILEVHKPAKVIETKARSFLDANKDELIKSTESIIDPSITVSAQEHVVGAAENGGALQRVLSQDELKSLLLKQMNGEFPISNYSSLITELQNLPESQEL